MQYPDVFFTPEYRELFKDTAFGGGPCHFYSVGIDYHFYKRPIKGTPYCDIVSPYGYSGPVRVSECGWWSAFLSDFHDYCLKSGIIDEFTRLHPFIENHKYLEPSCLKYEHEIFYIDLAQSEDEIWRGFDKGCKSAIKKISKSHIHVDAPIRGIADFFGQLYRITMLKANASNQYFFVDDWFLRASQTLDLWSSFAYDGSPVSGAILLKHGDYCHYFLATGGNQNLILWEAIKWAKTQGCKIFNLGGGLKAGDSLESFKRSFAKTSKPFYTYRKIHNHEVYNQLCQSKDVQPSSEGFFPAYRRA